MKRSYPNEPRLRWRLIIQIIFVYYLTLGALILLALHSDVLRGPDEPPGTNIWLNLIQVHYYLVPVVLAIVFGWLFRPFRRNFRNLLFCILVIQIAYSFIVFCLRHDYAQRVQAQINQARLQTITPQAFQHRFLDEDRDGLVEKVQFAGYVDAKNFPPGEYMIRPQLTQKGIVVTQADFRGDAKFTVTEERPKPFMIKFEVNPQSFSQLFVKGDFELNLTVLKVLNIDQEGQRLLQWARWAPYLRMTSWMGEDLEIQQRVEKIDDVGHVDTFNLLPLQLERQ